MHRHGSITCISQLLSVNRQDCTPLGYELAGAKWSLFERLEARQTSVVVCATNENRPLDKTKVTAAHNRCASLTKH